MSTRKLGTVREALTAAGMDLTYAYEDLVFPEHNAFLLQFTDKENELLIHKNAEAREDELTDAVNLLQQKATEVGLIFTPGQRYRISQDENENIEIEFL